MGCPSGQSCGRPFEISVNLCLDVHGVGGSCDYAVCDVGLECNTGDWDALHIPNLATMACARTCQPGASEADACTHPQQCLPSSTGPVLQRQDAGVVACDVDGGAAACDQSHGFTCVALPEGARCAKTVFACGTAVPLYPGVLDLLRNVPDQAAINAFISSAYAANFGPDYETDTGTVILAGRRFCDGYPDLANAAAVKLHPLFSDAAIGPCVGLCNDPPIPAHVPGLSGDVPIPGAVRACPTGFHCSSAQETPERAVVGGASPVTCQVDGDCGGYPGSVCWTEPWRPAGPKVCAYRFPVCVGDVASTGSSSSG